MHNELVSYIQSNHAGDGIEVRAVGPKAVTLAFPPELHDLGNLVGELEMAFNARVDLAANDTPGLGPTATVWVMQGDTEPDSDGEAAASKDAATGTEPDAPEPAQAPSPRSFGFNGSIRRCCTCNLGTAVVATMTVMAAAFSIANNGASLWKHLEL